jgi:hypothetical protein
MMLHETRLKEEEKKTLNVEGAFLKSHIWKRKEEIEKKR